MDHPILVDTDILVDFLRGYNKAVEFVNAHVALIILSSIVVAELYAGVKGEQEQAALDSFISIFQIVSPDLGIAKAAGLYKRNYGKSHGVGLADALIAATAEAENAELKTLNIIHYPMFKNMSPAYRKQ